MTWRLVSFGGVTLPVGAPVTPVGTAPSWTAGVALPGGEYFDQEGSSHAQPRLPYVLMLKATISADTPAALETLLFGLETLNGLRADTLIRVLADGVTQQWCTARLVQMPADREARHRLHQPVVMQFQVLSRWFSATAKTVTGTLSSAATTVTLANAGTARVTAVTITVTAVGGGPLTGVKVGRTGYTELEYTGVIQPSKALEINTGAWSVLNDGVADYTTEHFRLTANHHEVFWLRLPRLTGADVVVTRTGGSATDTAVFSYYEAWQ